MWRTHHRLQIFELSSPCDPVLIFRGPFRRCSRAPFRWLLPWHVEGEGQLRKDPSQNRPCKETLLSWNVLACCKQGLPTLLGGPTWHSVLLANLAESIIKSKRKRKSATVQQLGVWKLNENIPKFLACGWAAQQFPVTEDSRVFHEPLSPQEIQMSYGRLWTWKKTKNGLSDWKQKFFGFRV